MVGGRTGADSIGKRRGKRAYSDTTLRGYDRSLRKVLVPEFGARPAAEINAREWQLFVDRLARERPVALAHRKPSRGRPRDLRLGRASRPAASSPRTPRSASSCRPSTKSSATASRRPRRPRPCWNRSRPRTACPFALAFYAGLRRSEMDRLQWEDVDLERLWLSCASQRARPAPAAPADRRAAEADPPGRRRAPGPPESGRVLGRVSLTSGRLVPRADQGLARRRHRGAQARPNARRSIRSACTSAATPTRAS